MIPLYIQDLPALPADTPAWIAILFMLLSTVSYLIKRWADSRVATANREATQEHARAESFKRQLDNSHQSLEILYVDNNPADYELFDYMLKSVGCTHALVWRRGVDEGYVYMRENHERIVFCIVDIKMVTNGSRFLAIAKSDSTTRELPVIVTSGIVPEDIDIYRKGAIGYIAKPIQLSVLMQILTKHGFSWSVAQAE